MGQRGLEIRVQLLMVPVKFMRRCSTTPGARNSCTDRRKHSECFDGVGVNDKPGVVHMP